MGCYMWLYSVMGDVYVIWEIDNTALCGFAVFSQLTIFTADCLRHPTQMAGIETIWELHTLTVINSWSISYNFVVADYQ